MGKGDKKTKRGKINSGSFGKLRPRGRNKRTATTADVPTKQTAKKTMEAGFSPANIPVGRGVKMVPLAPTL